jgi:uncharacterized ferritin-like protein (DUF455 family)
VNRDSPHNAADTPASASARIDGTCTPRANTVERWAWDYVTTRDLAVKVAPPAPPREWESSPPSRRIARPGRPPALVAQAHARKTPSTAALRDPARRAQVVHTFWHHEMQAAELMCWALLAFADAPLPLRRGLLAICQDEIRHMAMYANHLRALDSEVGRFEVNDWFWERVPKAACIEDYLATMGVGFEGGNLDHAPRFAARFRVVGDHAGAAMQDAVAEEEIPHVRFALHWLRELTGALDFDRWRARLPEPLSPMIMRGLPLAIAARKRAGFDDVFLERMEQWGNASRGS